MSVLRNTRWERFAQELAAGKSATEAYELAGFKPDRGNAAHLQQRNVISQRVSELLFDRQQMAVKATEKAVEKLALTREWVLGRLVENAERAMQARAVTGPDGEPTGEYRYEGNVANRALELLGKELGMFIDRKEVGGPGDFDRLEDDALLAELKKEAAELGISAKVLNGKGNGTAH